MDAPSLDVLIAADATKFPIAQILKKMPNSKKYLCKTSRGTSSIVDCKEKLEPGTVFFYQPISQNSVRSVIGFKRIAMPEEASAYQRYIQSKNMPLVEKDPRRYYDRASF